MAALHAAVVAWRNRNPIPSPLPAPIERFVALQGGKVETYFGKAFHLKNARARAWVDGSPGPIDYVEHETEELVKALVPQHEMTVLRNDGDKAAFIEVQGRFIGLQRQLMRLLVEHGLEEEYGSLILPPTLVVDNYGTGRDEYVRAARSLLHSELEIRKTLREAAPEGEGYVAAERPIFEGHKPDAPHWLLHLRDVVNYMLYSKKTWEDMVLEMPLIYQDKWNYSPAEARFSLPHFIMWLDRCMPLRLLDQCLSQRKQRMRLERGETMSSFISRFREVSLLLGELPGQGQAATAYHKERSGGVKERFYRALPFEMQRALRDADEGYALSFDQAAEKALAYEAARVVSGPAAGINVVAISDGVPLGGCPWWNKQKRVKRPKKLKAGKGGGKKQAGGVAGGEGQGRAAKRRRRPRNRPTRFTVTIGGFKESVGIKRKNKGKKRRKGTTNRPCLPVNHVKSE